MPYNYKPPVNKLPPMPNLSTGSSSLPKTNIKNTYAKNILDTIGKNIKPAGTFTNDYKIDDVLFPTQELGNQFVQKALLPDFNQDVYNPYRRGLGNQAGASNLSLLGGGQRYIDRQEKQVQRQFNDQATGVQNMFSDLAYQDLNDLIGQYYDDQFNF